MGNERLQEREIESFVDINANYNQQWVFVAVTKIENNVPTAGVVLSHVQEMTNLDLRLIDRLKQKPSVSAKFAIFRAGLDREPS